MERGKGKGMPGNFGYVRAARDEATDQETVIRVFGHMVGRPVSFVFSDRAGNGKDGLKEALGAVKAAGGGMLVIAHRKALGDYRKIDQAKNRLRKMDAELVILSDPYQDPTPETTCCEAILKALEAYREAKSHKASKGAKRS